MTTHPSTSAAIHNGSPRYERILIVACDPELRRDLAETLEDVGRYQTTTANSFEEALSEILLTDFDLIVTETALPDLSGIDLLAVVGGLRPRARVIVVDDDLSAKSAVAVYRLGAVDYLYKPLNLSFLLMQIERHLELRRQSERPLPAPEPAPAADPPADRARRLDPRTRPVALMLGRAQFRRIHEVLEGLLQQVHATFVGVIDSDGNMVGAAGTLEEYDLQLLTGALNIDHSAQQSLASILEETKFHSRYFEGTHNGVYIVEFGAPHTVSLAVISKLDAKQGMVWLYTKRTANAIDEVLKALPKPRRYTGL